MSIKANPKNLTQNTDQIYSILIMEKLFGSHQACKNQLVKEMFVPTYTIQSLHRVYVIDYVSKLKGTSQVNMEYFPFDTQRCPLKYGSWAYSQNYINLQHLTVTNGILGEVNFTLKQLVSHYNLRVQKEK